MMDAAVDKFFKKGRSWEAELVKLREVLLSSKLDEELKWGKPCYSSDGNNIAIIQPMKAHVALMFFKGELFDDPAGVLQPVGPNSRSARRMLFTSVTQIEKSKKQIKALVKEALGVEESGLTVQKPTELDLCPELQARLEADRALAAGFSKLTPGRKRAYNIYISGAKQASTREGRIDKYVDKIKSAKGLRD